MKQCIKQPEESISIRLPVGIHSHAVTVLDSLEGQLSKIF